MLATTRWGTATSNSTAEWWDFMSSARATHRRWSKRAALQPVVLQPDSASVHNMIAGFNFTKHADATRQLHHSREAVGRHLYPAPV